MEEKLQKIKSDEIENINTLKESLTVEKFRKLTGLENISEAEAQATILAINCLVNILIEHDLEEERTNHNEIEYNLKQAA